MTRFATILSICTLLLSCKEEKKEAYTTISKEKNSIFASTKQIPDAHYLGDQKCKECHREQFKGWQNSHHDKAMQIATRKTILANFNGEKFKSQGVTSHFFEKETHFYVNTEGPDEKNHDYKIEYVFGIKPLQQYIVKFPDGHYQCLRTAWNTKENRWFDLYPNFKVVHSEWLHWSRGGLNWNTMCSDCHSTNVRKNYTEKTHSYNTQFSLINVSCEACHGPGKNHVNSVENLEEIYKGSQKMYMTSKTKPKELVAQCARCHMRREQISENYNHEGDLFDHYYPQLISEPIYHADGQILDEDYVYGSFVQSKMYHNNVTCTDCHNAHSLKLKFEGNNLCTQCHEPKKYNTEKHHFHKKGTEAAKCINCHMPGKFYMGNDFRRDHSFRIPRPDLSEKYGTPNACNSCHTDKSTTWAKEKFLEIYGGTKEQHFSELLLPGLRGESNAQNYLTTLANDTLQPEIARASAIKGLSKHRNRMTVKELLAFLNDDSTLVRASSIDALNEIGSTEYLKSFIPLLKDSIRSVRIKAFNALGKLPENQIPKEYSETYKKVEKEFITYLNVTSDFVGGHVNKANYLLKKGDLKGAIKGHESALSIDPLNNIVRTNLANLYYQNKEFEKAEDAFQIIIKQEPNYGPTYYSYGLLLAELKRPKEAIKQLELALKYLKENPRIYYNLSLLYKQIKKYKKAEKTLLKGLQIVPNNENLLYALAYHYFQNSKKEKAKTIGLKLVELYPNNQNYATFLRQLEN